MPPRKRKLDGNDCMFCANHLEDGQDPVKLKRHTKKCTNRTEDHLNECVMCKETKEQSMKSTTRTQDWRKDQKKSDCVKRSKLESWKNNDRKKILYNAVQDESVDSEEILLESITFGRTINQGNQTPTNSEGVVAEEIASQTAGPSSVYKILEEFVVVEEVNSKNINIFTVAQVPSTCFLPLTSSRLPSGASLDQIHEDVSHSSSAHSSNLLNIQVPVPTISSSIFKSNRLRLESNYVPDASENAIILAVCWLGPTNFALSESHVEDLQTKIELEMDKISDNEECPKFYNSPWDGGFWKVSCANEFSMIWFEKQASKYPLQIIKTKSIPKFKCKALIHGPIIMDEKIILNRFARDNKAIKLQTSRWDNLEWLISNKTGSENSNENILSVDVDLSSMEKILENGSALHFGIGKPTFQFQDFYELEVQ